MTNEQDALAAAHATIAAQDALLVELRAELDYQWRLSHDTDTQAEADECDGASVGRCALVPEILASDALTAAAARHRARIETGAATSRTSGGDFE